MNVRSGRKNSPGATLVLISLVFLSPWAAGADHSINDEQAVLATVQAFFDAMATRDDETGGRITVPDGVFVNLRMENGQKVIRHFSNAQWLAGLPTDPPITEAFDGPPTVLINGDVAMVWGSYTLSVDGKFSHTGVDVFNLLRTPDGWKITGGAYSVIKSPEDHSMSQGSGSPAQD